MTECTETVKELCFRIHADLDNDPLESIWRDTEKATRGSHDVDTIVYFTEAAAAWRVGERRARDKSAERTAKIAMLLKVVESMEKDAVAKALDEQRPA